ncbi:gp16 family protein [Nitrosovibrio sp. Nv4]|uniref:gp16 family protein n=1 Tax=Nitrosovibrio sp. Nv4 TaxID=1945880 RepID=UPI000BDB740C|nr:regulatory protein GemA [Nitrosovibrio sp. Nv4]SOD42309.1 Mu-like prophage protein gp16 [Nitrosovibrio sp. Nv4]
MKRPTPDLRKRELAQIHIGKAQLGLDDETYRAMLQAVAGVGSSAELDHAGRRLVLQHMRARGWKNDRKRVTPPSATQSKQALMRKIAAMLHTAGRPWQYADGMARHMFAVEKAAWCDVAQLRKIIAALGYDAKRRQGHG